MGVKERFSDNKGILACHWEALSVLAGMLDAFLPPCHVRCALCHFCRWPLQQRRLSAVPPARRVIGRSLQSLPGAWSQSQLNGKRVCVRVCARLCVCVCACVCVVRTCRRDKMTGENTCRRKLIGRGTTGKLKFPTS